MSLTKISKLGYGVYSKIYKVRDEEGEEHALKVCLKECGFNFGMSYREADIALRFDHPNVACLRGTFEGNPFGGTGSPASPLDDTHERMTHDDVHLLYELANCSLDSYMDKHELSYELFVSILSDILLGIEYIHESGYMHRDLRIDNILLFYNNCGECEGCKAEDECESKVIRAKVTDFGFIKPYLKYDVKSPYVNSVNHRAPECLMESTFYDTKIDIWALGYMAYLLIKRKHIVEDPLCKTNLAYLEYMSKMLPYSFPEHIRKQYNLSGEGVSFEKFFSLPSSYSDPDKFKQFFMGVFAFDPSKRLTARECLDLPLFDPVRDNIIATRNEYPPLKHVDFFIETSGCIERNWAALTFNKLYSERKKEQNKKWYTDRIFFLAFSIMEDVLVYLQKYEQNKNIVPTDKIGTLLTMRHFHIIYIVCLYFAIKYTTGTSSSILSFQDIYPRMEYKDEEFAYAKNFELKLFREILGQAVYRETLYESLLKDKVPQEMEINSMVHFCLKGYYKNMTTSAAYKKWQSYHLRYRKKK